MDREVLQIRNPKAIQTKIDSLLKEKALYMTAEARSTRDRLPSKMTP